jgi:hypothetical protein
MPFPTQMNNAPIQTQNIGTGQRGIVNQYSGRIMPQGMSMQQAMAQRGMQMPVRPSQQQFAPQMGQPPLPNPTAEPPMLQPAGMSQLGPQQGMPYGQPPMGQPAFPMTSNNAPVQAMSTTGQTGIVNRNTGQMMNQGLSMQDALRQMQAQGQSLPAGAQAMLNQAPQAQNMAQGLGGLGNLYSQYQQTPMNTITSNQTGQTAGVLNNQMPSINIQTTPMSQQQFQAMPTAQKAYAEGGQVQMPDPNAWRPPMNTLGQMPPSMQMQPPMMPPIPQQGIPQMPPQGMSQMPQGMPPMAAQGAAPTGLMPQGGMGMPQRFANGGPVSAQDQLGGTQIAKRYAQGGKANHLANTDADDQVMQALSRDPQFDALINQGHDELGDMPIEALNEFISMIRMALRHPEKYPEIRMAAIRDKMVEPDDMPEQFDAQMLVSMLTTLVALKKKQEGKTAKTQKLASGGLAKAAEQLQKKGRNGDTVLAHINPQEAAMLRAQGGTGTINPATGLVEYGFFSKLWKAVKSIAKVVAPIALSFLAPGVGTWIGSTFLGGLGATAASVVGGALGGGLMGAAGAAITGGNIGQGALLGGALGGIRSGYDAYKGAQAAKALTASGEAAGASGAAGSAAAATPATTAVDQAAKSVGTVGATGGPASTATLLTGGNAAAAPLNPLTAGAADLTGKSAATLATNATSASLLPTTAAPSAFDSMVRGAKALGTTALEKLPSLGGEVLKTGALMAATGALGGGGAPADVMPEVQKLSPSQQEYFNRPNVQWDWDRIKSDASSTGMSLSEFMNQNWGAISGGNYNKAETNFASDQAKTQNAARGGRSRATSGALSKVAYLAQGSGSGRADTIDAKLSDGEYVIDAETVALLGDGSTKEGARRLDMMRQQLRQQKGKQLARGQFSTSAKMPLAYVKGAR